MTDREAGSNGPRTNPLQRLASFKSPRDLTLGGVGGVKPNKKIFVPNLNAARVKNKGLPIGANTRVKGEEKVINDRRNDRNRTNRPGPKIIKTSGVFSEGLAPTERTSRVSYSTRSSTSSSVIQKPTINVKDVIKIDKELEEQKIESAMGFANQKEELFTFRTEPDVPIIFPLVDYSSFLLRKPNTIVKKELEIKTEPGAEVDCGAAGSSSGEVLPSVPKKEIFEGSLLADILKTGKSTLMQLKFPYSLPGRCNSAEDDRQRRNPKSANEPSTSNEDIDTQEKQNENRCLLSDLEEGQIGKLQIHRSGRVTLEIGNISYQVSISLNSSCYVEAVSLAADDASNSARITSLGRIEHNLIVAPDWENLLGGLSI